MKKVFTLRRIVIIVSALVLVFVCAVLISERLSGVRAANVQQDVFELRARGQSTENSAPAKSDETDADDNFSEEEEEIVIPDIHSDFIPLYEENEDIIGWLTAGHSVDFPIMQKDNEYYLNHDFFNRKDSNGTPFMDSHNKLFPRDDVLIIHGHNMKSGAVFGKLKRFMDFDYLCEYPVVTFRTIYDEADVYYTPIAVFNVSMTPSNAKYFDITRVKFENDADSSRKSDGERKSAEFESYLDELRARSMWEPLTDVDVNDNLLMLITCSYYFSDGRLMVICRELRDGETPESITALYADAAS